MRILLVRLRLIGDVASTTPLIGALRRRFPAAHLAYLVKPLAAPVVEPHPALDRVHIAAAPRAPGRLRADLRLARAQRRERFDVVIDLHGGPRAAWLAWSTGAPRRIGYAVHGRAWMYTGAVARPAALTPRHAVENQWDMLAPLKVPPPEAGPTRELAAVAARDGAPGAGQVLSLVVPLALLPALIRRAAVYIGGDSGPLHLTGGTPTPVVGLFGATLPETAMPWRDPRWRAEAVDGEPLPCRQRTCAPGDFRCLTAVTVDAVAAAAERAMTATGTAARSTHA